jgi:hypothetical protein
VRLLGLAVLLLGLVAVSCSEAMELGGESTTTAMVSVPVADDVTEVAEAPWVAPGEILIGSSVITVESKALDAGSTLSCHRPFCRIDGYWRRGPVR